MTSSADIRQQFIDFFVQKHAHRFVPSSPVVPHDDPTLLFTNAGMNQFKPVFLGLEKRDYTRVANTQKCIRAGGKHNDLDDVGRSRRHHTFFEMLGNWSFGDYFKREAIAWSWELLTKVWGLDPTRLHVTVHAGDPAIGVARDDEAANLWREVAGVPDDHIHYGNTKDNFWEMGETGPCGPCTEIFVDRTPDKTGGPTVLSGEDPRVMEIWNNVFIQYNRTWKGAGEAAVRAFDTLRAEPLPGEDIHAARARVRLHQFGTPDRAAWLAKNTELQVLPAKHVDTGMGFERVTQVLQGVGDNYAIDLFNPFWQGLKDLSGITYTGKYPRTNAAEPEAESKDAQLRHDIAFRVIADHIRCLTFALTDGAVPSNEGRGYVLRRILERAVRFGRQQLELREPFLHTLVPVVVDAMGAAFPELKRDPRRVVELIKDEEISFGRTLDRGIALFNDAATLAEVASRITDKGPLISDTRLRGPVISGDDAFKLHDTYGFPIDLTQIMATERGMTVDFVGYERLMDEAKERARAAGKQSLVAVLGLRDVPATDDDHKYRQSELGARIIACADAPEVTQPPSSIIINTAGGSLAAGERAWVILDRTCFYGEQGGQVGDAGVISSATGVFQVENTLRSGEHVIHAGFVREGYLSVGDDAQLTVDNRRDRTQQNHTATHLANWALREVLGDDVQQKGSLVDPDKLRFDFSHGKAVTEDEIGRVETLVQQCIEKKLPVYAEVAPQEQAIKINSLRAVFGEKYPPMVRVVSIGVPVADLLKDPSSAKWRQYSIEFCGGTHLKNSADAGGFVVTGEESVSKGIRRIVALTGDAARDARAVERRLDELAERARKAPESELTSHLADLSKALAAPNLPLRGKRRGQAAVAELQAKLKAFEKSQKASAGAGLDVGAVAAKLLAEAEPLGGGKLVVAEVPGAGADQLLATMDSLRKKQPSLALMLGSADGAKVSFCAAVSNDLIAEGLKAGDWIRETAKVAGGGGGGRPQMAQAGGKDPSKLPDALARAREFARGAVK